MNTRQLYRAVNSDLKMQTNFIGVFPCDKLPQHRQGCMIVNEDPSTKEGSHWVAIFLLPNNQAEYFDSYGSTPRVQKIENYLKGYDTMVNTKQVQSLFSTTCGQHCLYYLHNRCRGLPYGFIVDSYSTQQQENDEMVSDFMSEQFDMDLPTHDDHVIWQQISTALKSI